MNRLLGGMLLGLLLAAAPSLAQDRPAEAKPAAQGPAQELNVQFTEFQRAMGDLTPHIRAAQQTLKNLKVPVLCSRGAAGRQNGQRHNFSSIRNIRVVKDGSGTENLRIVDQETGQPMR